MTKKHFIALADVLRANKPETSAYNSEYAQWQADCIAVAAVCRKFNPAFNSDRWFDYIMGLRGPSGGKV